MFDTIIINVSLQKNNNTMNRIELLIKEKGYNMTSFAEKMNTTRQNLYAILKSPSYPTLERVAEALNVPMWQLFASPEDVTGEGELTALIQYKGEFYKATTIAELEKIATEIKEK